MVQKQSDEVSQRVQLEGPRKLEGQSQLLLMLGF